MTLFSILGPAIKAGVTIKGLTLRLLPPRLTMALMGGAYVVLPVATSAATTVAATVASTLATAVITTVVWTVPKHAVTASWYAGKEAYYGARRALRTFQSTDHEQDAPVFAWTEQDDDDYTVLWHQQVFIP